MLDGTIPLDQWFLDFSKLLGESRIKLILLVIASSDRCDGASQIIANGIKNFIQDHSWDNICLVVTRCDIEPIDDEFLHEWIDTVNDKA